MKSKIKAEEVNVDGEGFWTHSKFPDIGENCTQEFFDAAMSKLGGRAVVLSLFDDENIDKLAYEAMEYHYDYRKWTPECNEDDAFLLSKHDCDDGPIAVFFVPNKPDTPMINEND